LDVSRGKLPRYPLTKAEYIELSQGLKKEACKKATKSALISCRTTFAIVLEVAGARFIGQSLAVGAFGVCEIMVPLASWMHVEEVAVKIIVQPLLQYSATPTSERLRTVSGKI
jgi:hypothetical protein